MQAADFLPPILVNALKKTQKKLSHAAPMWQEVKAGLHEGLQIYVPQKGVMFEEMLTGKYDTFMWDWMAQVSWPEDSIVLDIGGHIGFSAMGFAKGIGNKGKVLCFEPNPINIERIKMHLEKNKEILKNKVTVHSCALADKAGQMSFFTSDKVDDQTSSGGHLSHVHTPLEAEDYKAADFAMTQVAVKVLDEVLESENIDLEKVKLLKIDVEGAEGLVLKGAQKLLATAKPYLLIEVHSVQAMLEVIEVLLPLKYNIKIIENSGPARCFILASNLSKK